MKTMGRYVVRKYQPWRARVTWIAIAAFGVVLAAVTYHLGHAKGRADFLEISERAAYHQGVNQRLRTESSRLRSLHARIARTAKIQAQATRQLQRTISQQQAVLADERQELAFYRSLAVVNDRGLDLRIIAFEPAARVSKAGRLTYVLAVARVRRDELSTSAQARVNAVVAQNGVTTTLPAEQLNGAAGAMQNFQFRHYRRVTGDIVLPPGTQLLRLVVEVTALGDDGGDTTVQQSYPWPASAHAAVGMQ